MTNSESVVFKARPSVFFKRPRKSIKNRSSIRPTLSVPVAGFAKHGNEPWCCLNWGIP
jgi:hypothetical protein